MKSQATTMVAMQDQLTNIQQFCMAVGQQPLPNIYVPAQQQHTFNNRRNRRNGGGHGNGGTVVAMVVVVVVSHNNQPGSVSVATVPVHNNPRVLTLPTSIGKIGTTAILMAVT